MGSVFSTGKSQAKKQANESARQAEEARKQAEEQQRRMEEQARIAKEEADKQLNVSKAQQQLAEDQMFQGTDEGLGIESIDTSEIGGTRKRRRKEQQTSSGLGI